ncbi:MAG TPA: DUF362 domain-containing protein [Nitrospira sp.]|nr:DUF362 domain-containing protein [Nitrospira sp.]
MRTDRRQFLETALLGAGAALTQSQSKAAEIRNPGIPGPYPGRVIAVDHRNCIVSGVYQPETIRQMVERGMKELTGAPAWQDAWRSLFAKGDVVGIKVSPVGGPKLCSDASVLHAILDGLDQAGVSGENVIVFSRYREEILDAGIDKWLRPGNRFDAPSLRYDNVQLDMGGYDGDHFMEMAIVKPGDDPSDPHSRRSYVANVVSKQVTKIINLPVLKHHQSAGVTIALKNMSHGFVNNVNRSHITPTANACGVFIPSVVSLPIIRQKTVLHIVDAVKACYHGGPSGKPQYIWEPKTLYFGTDPVALDKTGLKAIDAKRHAVGMASIALSKPDEDSHYLNCQVEHIEIAGMMGLGQFDDDKIKVSQIHLA